MASKTLVRIGGTAPGTAMDMFPKTLKAALGLPIRVLTGYKGTSHMALAIESGELDGVCYSWQSMKVKFQSAFKAGDLIPILVAAPKASADLPHLPLAIELAKTDGARQLIEVGVHTAIEIAFTLALPPGTPKDRLQILRQAFESTYNDAEFLAEAKKTNIEVVLGTGEELEKRVGALFNLDPNFLAKFEKVVYE